MTWQGLYRSLVPWVLVGLSAASCHLAHLRLQGTPLPQSSEVKETLPSADALRLISLGYPQLTADYYWLRAISHFGDGRMHKAHYPNLEPLLRRVVALDPYFASAYIFAGTVLTLKGMDSNAAMELLEQGEHRRPDVWRIPWLAGFNAYYVLNDYAHAAQALGRAARYPGVPPFVGALATRLSAEAGEPEVGLQLVDAMLATVHEPSLVEQYQARRRLLELELHLKWLNIASQRYHARLGRWPTTLEELTQVGLRTLPTEPLGGSYRVNPETGAITSTHEAERLRLRPDAKGLPHGG